MKIVAYAILAAAALAAPAAEARSRDDAVVTARITFGDLDLSQPAGRAALERRVSAAVRQLCPAPSAADPKAQANYRICREDVSESAHQKLAMALDRRADLGNMAD